MLLQGLLLLTYDLLIIGTFQLCHKSKTLFCLHKHTIPLTLGSILVISEHEEWPVISQYLESTEANN